MFNRFGRLVRCDIPTPRLGAAARSLYAYVEFEDWRAAEDAYQRLHGKPFGSGVIKIQWARNVRKMIEERNGASSGGASGATFYPPRHHGPQLSTHYGGRDLSNIYPPVGVVPPHPAAMTGYFPPPPLPHPSSVHGSSYVSGRHHQSNQPRSRSPARNNGDSVGNLPQTKSTSPIGREWNVDESAQEKKDDGSALHGPARDYS